MSACKKAVHVRREHTVRGHFRTYSYGRVWVNSYQRSATIVNDHCVISI